MDVFLTYSHIIAGTTALLVGLLLMFRPKGTRTHVILGWIYAISMFWICASAFSIVAFYRFSFFLMIIGVLTFYSTFVGVRVTRRKEPGNEKWYDWGAAIVTCLFAIGLYGYAIYIFIAIGFHILGMLSIVFGTFTFINGWRDLKFFKRSEVDHPKWWLHQHIIAMGSSYIAAVTAFAVQNGDVFMPKSSLNWFLWILPGVFGGFIIRRVVQKSKG